MLAIKRACIQKLDSLALATLNRVHATVNRSLPKYYSNHWIQAVTVSLLQLAASIGLTGLGKRKDDVGWPSQLTWIKRSDVMFQVKGPCTHHIYCIRGYHTTPINVVGTIKFDQVGMQLLLYKNFL